MQAPYGPASTTTQAVRRHATTCAECGAVFVARRTGRKRRFCSNQCRDAHRRQLNFEVSGTARYPTQAKPRNAENPPTVSKDCEPVFAGRGSGICGSRTVIEAEIGAAHVWTETASSSGVVSLVAQLRPPALVGPRHE